MTQRVNSSLTPEEQAEVMHIQERVIELFGDRDAAVAAGDSARCRRFARRNRRPPARAGGHQDVGRRAW
jgi:hypothetical protein